MYRYTHALGVPLYPAQLANFRRRPRRCWAGEWMYRCTQHNLSYPQALAKRGWPAPDHRRHRQASWASDLGLSARRGAHRRCGREERADERQPRRCQGGEDREPPSGHRQRRSGRDREREQRCGIRSKGRHNLAIGAYSAPIRPGVAVQGIGKAVGKFPKGVPTAQPNALNWGLRPQTPPRACAPGPAGRKRQTP